MEEEQKVDCPTCGKPCQPTGRTKFSDEFEQMVKVYLCPDCEKEVYVFRSGNG